MNTFETGSGRTRLRFTWQHRGNDLHVHIGGGEDHLGTAALVGRQPDGEICESVVHLPPHKEDELALKTARRLHAATGVSICVTAGIHLEAISAEEIATVLRNVDAGTERLAHLLRKR